MESGWDGMDGAHSRRLSISVPTAPRLRRGGAGGRRGRGLPAGRTRTPRAACATARVPRSEREPLYPSAQRGPRRPGLSKPHPRAAPPPTFCPEVASDAVLGQDEAAGKERDVPERSSVTRARTTRAATTRDAGAHPVFRGVPRGKFPALRGYRSSHHRFTCPGFCDYKRL